MQAPDNLRTLHDEWKQMGADDKAPYERAAAADANRYRREVYNSHIMNYT